MYFLCAWKFFLQMGLEKVPTMQPRYLLCTGCSFLYRMSYWFCHKCVWQQLLSPLLFIICLQCKQNRMCTSHVCEQTWLQYYPICISFQSPDSVVRWNFSATKDVSRSSGQIDLFENIQLYQQHIRCRRFRNAFKNYPNTARSTCQPTSQFFYRFIVRQSDYWVKF